MKLASVFVRVGLGLSLAVGFGACGDDGGGDDDPSGPPTDTGVPATTSGGATADGTAGSSDAPGSTGNADTTASSGPSDSTGTSPTDSSGGTQEDLDMTPEDFACLLDWQQVRRFRITNLLGHVDETLAVANSPDGGIYPVGTVIQLIPNEAMVKRAEGWSADTNDWEFFSLSTSAAGTEILDRGTTTVVNQFGGNCFSCHAQAEPQWDLVCEQDHGCDPIPVSKKTIEMLQQNDPRCR